MDEDNEKLCGQGGQGEEHVLEGKAIFSAVKMTYRIATAYKADLLSSAVPGEKAILDILRQKSLLDQRLSAELAKVHEQQSANLLNEIVIIVRQQRVTSAANKGMWQCTISC